MKSSIDKDSLNYATTFFSDLLRGQCEHFLFFGSLLGIIRDKGPILGDDDIDFYVNIKDYQIVKNLLLKQGFKIDYSVFPNQTERFIQVEGILASFEIRADFYFYDSEKDEDYIEERWNFAGNINDINLVLRIPKPLIFPLKRVDYQDTTVSIPRHSTIICEILYGVDWRIPQKKHIDYETVVIGGRPIRLKRGDNGSMSLLK